MVEKQTIHETDVVIVGAGPVGLFAVFELGMLGLRAHLVDSLEALGGQCTALYPEKPIYDIPGYPRIMAGELIDRLTAQIAPFQAGIHLNQTVTALDGAAGNWTIRTDRGTEIACKAVILAAGGGRFAPNRPPLENLQDYEGKSVFYAVTDKARFAGKRLVLAGGGDSAVDWALALAEHAESLALVHRRDKFRAAPESVARLRALAENGTVEMVTPYQLTGLEGTEGQLREVAVKTLAGEEKRLPADILLPFYGLAAELGPIAKWGMEIESKTLRVDPLTMQTNREGIYGIGDGVIYPNKLKLILTGFSEAATAAHTIWRQLHPGQDLHFEYSTTSGVPATKP